MLKKLSLLIACVLILNGAFAQESVNKRGVPVLPKKGNWGIGFDVVPIIKKAGNLFHNTDTPDLSLEFPFTVNARYCHSDKITYRAAFSFNLASMKTDSLVPKQGATNGNEQVADETIQNAGLYLASFGLQKWIGSSRVRGFFGGEVGGSIENANTKYNYGNDLGPQNTVQTRIARVKEGTDKSFFLRGFFGVEVYVAPKIALSAEYGFNPFVITGTSANEIETDSWDGSAVVTDIQSTQGKSRIVGFVTDNGGGAISLLFYF